MKQTINKINAAFSSFFRNRLNIFYVLAFLPLPLVMYSYMNWLFFVVVPVYGFIFLLIKKQDLSFRRKANGFQRVLGLLIAVTSFFVYYALILFFKSPAFYGGVNYALYIFGLFLIFFEFSALREAFTPIFLIVAATQIGFISDWLEPHFTRYIPNFVSLIVGILKTLGIKATAYDQIIELHTVKGNLSLAFVWGCVGVSSMLIFSIILVVTLFEESASLKTKLAWAFIGIMGTFIMNIVRVTIIFLADHFYGYEVGGKMHYGIGYVLFITWLVIFFYTFSKRQVISEKFQLIKQKLRSVTGRQKSLP